MLVEVRSLTKTFGAVRANDGISLRFAAGQIHGVLGENGAGKSTLMKLLAGYLRRTSGDILLNGQPVNTDTPAAALHAGVGMIHQDPLDIPAFTALENFYCASPRHAMPTRRVARALLTQHTAHLGFQLVPNTPVASLTVGQRQQLEIARLLACGVQVLILDEPTTGITAAQKEALFAALRQLASEGKTVLFVSHKLEEIASLCHTVSVLRAGRVAGDGQMPVPQPQDHLLHLMFGAQPPRSIERGHAATPLAPPADVSAVWHLASVTVQQDSLTLSDLHLTIPPGCVIGLSGLEGSGQQPFLRLLAGTLAPTSGTLHLNGRAMQHAPPAAYRTAGVEYLPADRMSDGVVGAFSLTDHYALLQQGKLLVDRAAAAAAARDAIATYNIKAQPDTPIAALSGGNQQRAMLALLPSRCRGLLLEQPTRGLDVVSARAIWQRLLDRRNTGTAIVFSSADFDELLDYSDYILVFFGGQVSQPVPRAALTADRLAEMIGGVGFVPLAPPATTTAAPALS